MAALFRLIAEALGWGKKPAKVLVVGLDDSGKTTLLNFLKPAKTASYEVAPTVGFSVERFETDSLRFEAFDMSGQARYRTLWESHYAAVNCVIFVVDSADKMRMPVAKDELDHMLAHGDIRGRPVPILCFANKMDKAGAMEPVEVMAALGLETITDRPWHIQASNALSGEGVDDGVRWLAEQLTRIEKSKGK